MPAPDRTPQTGIPACAVVVPAWNSAASIARCIKSVQRQSDCEICVVDNGSADATVEIVRRVAPAARIVQNASNEGFAAACNSGIAATRAEFVLCLNDDATLRDGYVAALVRALREARDAASAVGKLVYLQGGRQYIDSAGLRMDFWRLCPLDEGQGQPDTGRWDVARDIFGPTGAAAMYRRAALAQIPGAPFDPALFAYYEDVDLAWRLRRAGWRHLYVPRAVAEHERRGPHNKPRALAARAFANRYRVWRKNERLWRFCAYAPVCVPWEVARWMRLTRRDPKLAGAIVQDLWRGFARSQRG